MAGLAGLAAAAAVLAAGCATVPTVGQPRAVIGAVGQSPQFVQPIPPVPQHDWHADQIVLGFVAASASFASHHAAAQQFLSPAARRTFHLGSWPVTVVQGQLKATSIKLGPNTMQVTLPTEQLATISDVGQEVYRPTNRQYTFTVVKTGGVWRISHVSSPALLLSQKTFMDVFQPRNLYFWSPTGLSLVPEPVFAPQQDTYAAAAASLVNALLRTNQDRGDGQHDRTWLAGATQTAFPPGTTLIGNKVTIAGQTAIVNLGGAAARANSTGLSNMAKQLVTTLTSTSYGAPAIARHVNLLVNGQLADSNEQPDPPGGAPASNLLYYLASNGTVSVWSGKSSNAIRNPAGRDQIPFTHLAVLTEPSEATSLFAGAAPSGQGCTVYHGALVGTTALTATALPDPHSGGCTSVSWDSQGVIWAVTGRGIWVLPPGHQQFVPVTSEDGGSLPLLPGDSPAGYHVLSVRVAPDAVRVAMLIQLDGKGKVPGPKQVVMAAVTRTHGQFVLGSTVAVGPTLSDPIALSWLDPDDLVVLARSELYAVPVNGGAPDAITPAPAGAVSVTATGRGHIALAGGNQIWISSGPDQGMQQISAQGSNAAYQE
jgi:Lipoprotein LpqB beta-propeller domain/Sporulation and spore germination